MKAAPTSAGSRAGITVMYQLPGAGPVSVCSHLPKLLFPATSLMQKPVARYVLSKCSAVNTEEGSTLFFGELLNLKGHYVILHSTEMPCIGVGWIVDRCRHLDSSAM